MQKIWKRYTSRLGLVLVAGFFLAGSAQGQNNRGNKSPYGIGPYISDERVIAKLDCREITCTRSLSFSSLLRRIFPTMKLEDAGRNPLTFPEARLIKQTIISDLDQIQEQRTREEPDPGRRSYLENFFDGFRISDGFLTHEDSQIDLVGVVNRMDRQFLGQKFAASSCGEISLIYRFRYSIRSGNQVSRLPISMNLVFPAATANLDCRTVARRWLAALKLLATITPQTSPAEIERITKVLLDRNSGALAAIVPKNIDRVELNIQAYRFPAGFADDFGSEANYVIRVYRWDRIAKLFVPTVLPNQIDQGEILCGSTSCNDKKEALVAYLSRPETVEQIDRGLLNIPSSLGVLAERATSISPGGTRRSANQPYWNASIGQPAVISDEQIRAAIKGARQNNRILKYINSVEDFRTRLNDSTCTGCHQTRAIAGFHFAGADREGTARANSVLLPGSPHFFGDQPRRMGIVEAIAKSPSGTIDPELLATSYSARPHKNFAVALEDTQLIGGWGGTCLTSSVRGHKRSWSCRPGLKCVQLFRSRNDPDAGTCIPPRSKLEVGDPLQRGAVISPSFRQDRYVRLQPWSVDTRIPDGALPKTAPAGNSYYGSHQEFYFGPKPPLNCRALQKTHPKDDRRAYCYHQRRDRSTGGFPAGMLRLSECVSLPMEATCGLTASSGFNSCVRAIAENVGITINDCFDHFTSYSGMRACDRKRPCRDDYICVKPIEYDGSTTWVERRLRLQLGGLFGRINGRPYDLNDFGQARPDAKWSGRGDRKSVGFCIPPYFVFQFRSDKHGAPDPAIQVFGRP